MSDLAAATVGMDKRAMSTGQQAPVPSLGQIKTWFGANSLVTLLVAGAGMIAVVAALLMWAGTPTYRVLYSNLSEAEGGRIIAALDQQAVSYQLSEGGNAILVPSDKVHVLRLQLAEQGLPKSSGVGFELLDNQAFGISQFAEQLNFQRGLEGELVRSIKALGPVAAARIHLALAKRSVFVRNNEPAKASVLVTLHPGRVLDPGQVNAIMHLVSSSVPGLSFDNISVVNQSGKLLSDFDGLNKSLENNHLSHTQEIENKYQENIKKILTPLFGEENIRVQVTAQVNFSQKEETIEHYVPNQNTETAAIRSAQWSTNINGSTNTGSGVPGALSNSPPTYAAPITKSDKKNKTDEKGEKPRPQNSSNNMQSDNTVNYEVDRNITHIQHQPVRVERISSAVIVNYRQVVDEEGKSTQEPLSENELEQVTLLVKQAVGFSDNRGDNVQVVNIPFTEVVVVNEVEEEEEATPYWLTPQGQNLIFTLARYLAVGLAVILLYFFIIRPLLRQHTTPAVSEAGSIRLAVAEGSEGGEASEGGESSEDSAGPAAAAREKKRATAAARKMKTPTYDENIKELREVAKDDPRLFAMIVRTWVSENE